MAIRIPFVKKHKSIGYAACVERAAREMQLDEYTVATLLSYVFEEMTEQVCLNRIVRIPGFGVIGPMAWEPRKPGLKPFCYPGFSGSDAFRLAVRQKCPPDGAALYDIKRHRRTANTRKRKSSVRQVMNRMRNAFKSDARKERRYATV